MLTGVISIFLAIVFIVIALSLAKDKTKKDDADSVEVNIQEFTDKNRAAIPKDIFVSLQKAYLDGKDTATIPKSLVESISKNRYEQQKEDFALQQTSTLNNRGIAYEKDGDIISAIDTYEHCISYKQPATHAYDRLLVLYRKQKDYENELRVANMAADIFSEENERRANAAIKSNPELKEHILLSLETNEPLIDDNGTRYFTPYNVFKYIERVDKVKKKLS